jgi:CRISPR-associated protein Csb1
MASTPDAVRMLTLLALYKIAALLEGGLRLRTACDLVRAEAGPITADSPAGFTLPTAAELAVDLQEAIRAVSPAMTVTTFAFEDDMAKSASTGDEAEAAEDTDGDEA